jgi:alkanesulfonate monooxygenase SsuD/methylene tetrahydromethanopterin reductase-like flavin-dependent oxidoreductase (luciferase family)
MTPPTVAELERRIGQLRTLLRGEELVDDRSETAYRLHFAPEQPVPLYVAAASPRSLRMAGRVADGVVACVGVDRRLVEAALGHVATGAREAGRDPDEIRVVLWTAVAIEEDGVAARDLVRAFTASVVVPPLVGELPEPELETVAVIRARYDYAEHMRTDAEHRELVPDALVSRFAVAGTPVECREQLGAIFSYPIDQLALVPFAAAGGDRGAVMRRLAEEALPG